MKKTSIRGQKAVIPLVVLICTCFALQSCRQTEDVQESISPVTETELPNEAAPGETVSFVIRHYAYNGCGRYSRTETVEDGSSITVTLFAKYDQGNGLACPQALKRLETIYTFTPQRRGIHIFKFQQQDNVLSDTLIVR